LLHVIALRLVSVCRFECDGSEPHRVAADIDGPGFDNLVEVVPSTRGREIYCLRRRKPGTALFSTVPFEIVLRRPFTNRGANTVRKSAAK
jgi:hypothetical protein